MIASLQPHPDPDCFAVSALTVKRDEATLNDTILASSELAVRKKRKLETDAVVTTHDVVAAEVRKHAVLTACVERTYPQAAMPAWFSDWDQARREQEQARREQEQARLDQEQARLDQERQVDQARRLNDMIVSHFALLFS